MPKKSRLWCFTNFDLEFDYEKYLEDTTATYVAVGRETCPTTGKLHDQGWVYFEAQRGSVKQVAKQLGGCHVEMCIGNIDQNNDYCSKESELREFGVKPRPGRRSDIEDIVARVKDHGLRIDDLALENPNIVHQYGRTLDRVEDIVLRSRFRNWMTEGVWLYGPTGVGKSHTAFEGFNPQTHYVLEMTDNGWWDGYAGQEIVILNEFRGQIPFGRLLDLVDKWPVKVPRRGREPVPFLARKVIVTSCKHPRDIYAHVLSATESLDQLTRRFDIRHMEKRPDASSP